MRESIPHTARFFYGFDGFMYRQIVNGTETRFVLSLPSPGGRGAGRGSLVLQERDVNNAVTRSYVWDGISPGGIGGLLSMTEGAVSYSYIYDGKGNVVAVVNASGADVAKYRYEEFGVLAGQSGTPLMQPYQFSTKRYYDGFGLSYFGYRFYYANLGRWMTQDPIGIAGGMNLYEFVGNSPMNLIDEWGLIINTTNLDVDVINDIDYLRKKSPTFEKLYKYLDNREEQINITSFCNKGSGYDRDYNKLNIDKSEAPIRNILAHEFTEAYLSIDGTPLQIGIGDVDFVWSHNLSLRMENVITDEIGDKRRPNSRPKNSCK